MYNYSLVEHSTMPAVFKDALLAKLNFIEQESPGGLLKVLLFGSLARNNTHSSSDIDLCLVFEDSVDLCARAMRIFRTYLREDGNIDADVKTCHLADYQNNTARIYQEIRRDQLILYSADSISA